MTFGTVAADQPPGSQAPTSHDNAEYICTVVSCIMITEEYEQMNCLLLDDGSVVGCTIDCGITATYSSTLIDHYGIAALSTSPRWTQEPCKPWIGKLPRGYCFAG